MNFLGKVVFFFSIVSLTNLVLGDPTSILTFTEVVIERKSCPYFEKDWNVELHKSKKSTPLSINFPVTKQLPETMMINMELNLGGDEPYKHSLSVCDAVKDETIGTNFIEATVPKDKFAKDCPVIESDWKVSKWVPPADKIPPGVPDGPISGNVDLADEGQDYCIRFKFKGKLSHLAKGR